MTGVITWVVDCGDGVCVGGKPPLHFTQAKQMTASFISETADQELTLESMETMNGGTFGLIVALLTGCKPKKEESSKPSTSAWGTANSAIICKSGSSHVHGNYPDANCPDNSTQVKEGEGGCTDSVPF